MRRRDIIKAGLAGVAASSLPARAQSAWPQPGRTIKVIVPWPAGAANDALGRLFAQRLQEKLGATAIVENRTGGAGLIGTRGVIQAEPDGYTFLASAFNTAVMPMVIKGASFDPEIDLEVLARTAVAPLVCVISGGRKEKTVGEIVEAAKAKPKDWNFAISSLGSAGHLATIDFLHRAGVKIDMVPYRGTAPAMQDIMGGAVQLLIDPSFALLPATSDPTRARAIGIATRDRSVLAPDVPTMAEVGLPGYEFSSWYGVWGPKGLPRPIAERVTSLMQETMRDPDVVAKLRTTLLEPVSESVDETRRFIRSEIVRARDLLKSVNFEPS